MALNLPLSSFINPNAPPDPSVVGTQGMTPPPDFAQLTAPVPDGAPTPAGPPANEEEFNQRKAGWHGFMDQLSNNPDMQRTMLAIAGGLMSPVQPGESGGGHFAGAVLGGLDYAGSIAAARRKQDQEQQQLDLETQKTQANIEASRAETENQRGQLALAQTKEGRETKLTDAQIQHIGDDYTTKMAELKELAHYHAGMLGISQTEASARAAEAADAISGYKSKYEAAQITNGLERQQAEARAAEAAANAAREMLNVQQRAGGGIKWVSDGLGETHVGMNNQGETVAIVHTPISGKPWTEVPTKAGANTPVVPNPTQAPIVGDGGAPGKNTPTTTSATAPTNEQRAETAYQLWLSHNPNADSDMQRKAKSAIENHINSSTDSAE